jgi:hypothetical protein
MSVLVEGNRIKEVSDRTIEAERTERIETAAARH